MSDSQKRSPNEAAQMAVNAVRLYLRESGLQKPEDRQQWIKDVFEKVKAEEV